MNTNEKYAVFPINGIVVFIYITTHVMLIINVARTLYFTLIALFFFQSRIGGPKIRCCNNQE